jgi:undecaprenyl-diphosphatase
MALPIKLAPTLPRVAPPADPTGRRRLMWGVGLLAVFLLLTILTAVHTFNSPDLALDTRFHNYALAHRGADSLTKVVTFFGQPPVALGAGILFAIVFYLRHERQSAYFFAVSVVGSYAIAYLFKHVMNRHRPSWPVPVVSDTGPSYPSGHATGSNALATALIIGAMPLLTSLVLRWIAVALLVFYAAAEPLSRLVLGVHYPSDVVAGVLLGVGWPLLSAALLLRANPATARLR